MWRHATWSLRLSKNDVVEGVYSWASKLAAENRDLTSGNEIYVPHKSLIWIEERLKLMKGSIVGIVGLQGVGKSHVLMMLSEFHKIGESQMKSFSSNGGGRVTSSNRFLEETTKPPLSSCLNTGGDTSTILASVPDSYPVLCLYLYRKFPRKFRSRKTAASGLD